VRSHASTSTSGGGVGGTTRRFGEIRTPQASPGEQRPVGVEVAHVVRGVARRRECVEPEHVIADDAHVRLRDRDELAPESVERRAVEPARTRLQPRRIDEVRSAYAGHVNGQVRVLTHDRARGTGMVEVNV
jgi:hypothetical protein